MEDDEEVVVVGVKPIASFSSVQDLQWGAGEEEVGSAFLRHGWRPGLVSLSRCAECVEWWQHIECGVEYGFDGQSCEVTIGCLEAAVAWFFGREGAEACGAGWSEECEGRFAERGGHVKWSAVIGDDEISATEQFDELRQ